MSTTLILGLMTVLFLFFGYLGVPVAFSLMAGVFIGAATSVHDLAESAVRWTPPVFLPDDTP